MTIQILTLQHGYHKKEEVIFIHFPFNQEIINLLKKLGGARWSASKRVWYTSWSEEKLKQLSNELSVLADVRATGKVEQEPLKMTQINEQLISEKIEKFKNWMQSKRLAPSTIKTYSSAMKVFLNFFHDKRPEELTCDDVIRFNNEYLIKSKKSRSYQNQIVNGIKKFYSVVENKKLDVELIHRPKPEYNDPRVISKEDIKTMLESIKNLKHRTMLSLIYACGLRRGELISIELSHLDFNRKMLSIISGKGNKDRSVPLGEKLIKLLHEYIKAYTPKKWLFEGQKAGEKYGERSIQLVMKNVIKKAGLNEAATLHWLRHSYATHLHESGTDIKYIQTLLGHKSSRTTEIYTHVSRRSLGNIRSPFDDL